jgi:hypothetical protein
MHEIVDRMLRGAAIAVYVISSSSCLLSAGGMVLEPAAPAAATAKAAPRK